jgi:hypothetical protein
MTTTPPGELSIAAKIATAVMRGGGTISLAGEDIEVFLPDDLTHLLPALKKHKPEIVTLLRQQNSWPTPLSYPEYFCRLRAADFVPCSREEWEAEHGSDAERMARYERLCRRGARGEVVQ